MTSGSETLSATQYLDNELQVANGAMERQMLHISIRDKVRCIHQQTADWRHGHRIKQSNWRLAGHVARRIPIDGQSD